MSKNRASIGEFIVKWGWLIGFISLVTAGILYSISVQSLSFGLGHVDLMQNATDTSLLFAWAINLLEVIGVCWLLAKEIHIKENTNEDMYLNAILNIGMIVILVGDFAAIMYASGGFTNLPDDWFGKILAGGLRLVKSVIGAAGSEVLILLGLYLTIEWFKQYSLKPAPTVATMQPEIQSLPSISEIRSRTPASPLFDQPVRPRLDLDQSNLPKGWVRVVYPDGHKRVIPRHATKAA